MTACTCSGSGETPGVADFVDWWAAGVRAFGLGSELYKVGQSAEATFEKAKAVFEACEGLPR